MKKAILFLALSSVSMAGSQAQCAFDPEYADLGPGMFPEQLDSIVTCLGCGTQTRTVSIVTNTYMLVANPLQPGTNITLYIDSTKVLSMTGNPEGTIYGTDLGLGPDEMGIWGNTGDVPEQTAVQGCAYVTGNEAAWNAAIGGGPNNDGIYPLTITVDARLHSTDPDMSDYVPNGSWISGVSPTLGGGAIVFDTYQLKVLSDGTVGIEETAHTVGAYPNPASGQVRFNLGNEGQAMAELYDLRGNRLMQSSLTGSNPMLNLEGLADGLYIYRLYGRNGSLLATDRLAVMN